MKNNNHPVRPSRAIKALISIAVGIVCLIAFSVFNVLLASSGSSFGIGGIIIIICIVAISKALCKKYEDYFNSHIHIPYEKNIVIRFIANGCIASEKVYCYGEQMEVPNMPETVIINNVYHHFQGWMPKIDVPRAYGSQDYVANYVPDRK